MAARQSIEGYVGDLSRENFLKTLKMIANMSKDAAKAVEVAAKSRLDQLGVTRDLTEAVTVEETGTTPHTDVGTLITWMSRIQPQHKRAIRQLVAIDATAAVRCA